MAPLTTSDLLSSVSDNELISKLCRDSTMINSLNNLIDINQKNDTVIIKTTKSTVSIFSTKEYITLLDNGKSFSYSSQLGYYEKNFIIPDYEKELLLDWNIDSIQILCLYDDNLYECTPNDYVYQLIVCNGSIIRTNEIILHAKPAVPNEYVRLSKELIRRESIKNDLLHRNPQEYNRLFTKRNKSSTISKLKKIITCILN
ncbi:MAG: hypothetical protein K2L14_02695 [Duncaniella sp.]|nr:hypothetical protein [Duncaniella sp.]